MSEASVAEILRKVRRIQIRANRRVNDLFAGQYQSVFRGRGIEFDEVREYQPGDEIRTIDWNVTARAGVPFVKRYHEERELTVLFVVDVSGSGAFGSRDRSKMDLMIEVAALLMLSAVKNNDKVGLIRFCDEVLSYDPPRKGNANALRLLRSLVASQPVARPTMLPRALDFLNRVQKRRGVVFVLSDFLGPQSQAAFALTARRHELIAVHVLDPRERELPSVGLLTLIDAETGKVVEVDARSAAVRIEYARRAASRAERLTAIFRKQGIGKLELRTDEDYVAPLRKFFHLREKQSR